MSVVGKMIGNIQVPFSILDFKGKWGLKRLGNFWHHLTYFTVSALQGTAD